MWVWVVLGAIVVAMLATSPTVHAVLRRNHRHRIVLRTGYVLADEIRRLWSRSDHEDVRLAWAFYRLGQSSDASVAPSLAWFWRERRLLREVHIAVRDHPPYFLKNRLRLVVSPGLLWRRLGSRPRPRLPLRNRLWRSKTFRIDGRDVHGHPRPGRRGRAPFAFRGDQSRRAGWYSYPFWDDGWRTVYEELGPRTRQFPMVLGDELVWVPRFEMDREELQARREALDEQLSRLSDKISEQTEEVIKASVQEAVERKESDRDDQAPSAETGGVRGGGSSGGGSRSSSSDRDDWDSGGYGGSDW